MLPTFLSKTHKTLLQSIQQNKPPPKKKPQTKTKNTLVYKWKNQKLKKLPAAPHRQSYLVLSLDT